jgi:hypothetical protein
MLWRISRGIRRRCSNFYSSFPKGVQQKIDDMRGADIQHSRSPILRGLTPLAPSVVLCSCGSHDSKGVESLGLRNRKIVFVSNHLGFPDGSILLRVVQSAGRIAGIFPDTQVSVCATQSRDLLGLNQALIVLAKGCAIDSSRMKKLLRRDNILIADYVDGIHQDNIDARVNGFLCSSHTEFQWVSHRLLKNQQAALVPHAVDNRLLSIEVQKFDDVSFRCGYFGEPGNGLFAEELCNLGVLQLFETRTASAHRGFFEVGGWASQMRQYPVQYIARPSLQIRDGRFKPFTKGFQSAQLGQVVIGARFDAENRYWLGDDYPFFVEEETLESSTAAIQRCREAWEAGNLVHARAVMQKLRVLSCPVQNALDYRDALVRYLS